MVPDGGHDEQRGDHPDTLTPEQATGQEARALLVERLEPVGGKVDHGGLLCHRPAVREILVRGWHVAARTLRWVGMPARVHTYVEETGSVVNTGRDTWHVPCTTTLATASWSGTPSTAHPDTTSTGMVRTCRRSVTGNGTNRRQLSKMPESHAAEQAGLTVGGRRHRRRRPGPRRPSSLLLAPDRQRELHNSAVGHIGGRPQPSPVRRDNPAADRQPQAQPVRLGRIESVEQPVELLRVQA